MQAWLLSLFCAVLSGEEGAAALKSSCFFRTTQIDDLQLELGWNDDPSNPTDRKISARDSLIVSHGEEPQERDSAIDLLMSQLATTYESFGSELSVSKTASGRANYLFLNINITQKTMVRKTLAVAMAALGQHDGSGLLEQCLAIMEPGCPSLSSGVMP